MTPVSVLIDIATAALPAAIGYGAAALAHRRSQRNVTTPQPSPFDAVDESATILLCARDPFAAQVRACLIATEATFNRISTSWAAGLVPTLFEIGQNEATNEVGMRIPTRLAQGFAAACLTSGDVNRALAAMAAAYESRREHERECHDLLDTDDVIEPVEDMRLFGIGMVDHAHLPVEPLEPSRETLDRGPDRTRESVPVRMVHLAARDGLYWTVARRRGAPDDEVVALAQYPDSDDGMFGPVPHYLSRMVNAMVGNPVPIRPVTVPDDVIARWQQTANAGSPAPMPPIEDVPDGEEGAR